MLNEKDERRFWGKVALPSPETGCMEWLGFKNTGGYGRFRQSDGIVQAHRTSYELRVGLIPEGLHVDHLCRNRACVRPDHLEAVTNRENVRRGDAGPLLVQRHLVKTTCPKGHEYTPENTHINKAGHRRCRTCIKLKNQRYRYPELTQ